MGAQVAGDGRSAEVVLHSRIDRIDLYRLLSVAFAALILPFIPLVARPQTVRHRLSAFHRVVVTLPHASR